MQLTNKAYDVIKWIVTIVLPASAALYLGISGALEANGLGGLPYPEAVSSVIAAVTTFLGAIMHISTASYEGEGTLDVDMSAEDSDKYRLNLNVDPEKLATKKQFVLTVNPNAKIDSQN